uniref:CUE domain-containing protein n=1 Tax=Acrobeloides nanus TaxID=290746 RepID=A0A914DPP3_9BILA
MSITLNKDIVYESDEKELRPLSFKGTNKEEWVQLVTSANFYFEIILSFPSEAFWSTVAYSKVPLRLLDSFLNIFPRNYELAQKKLYFASDVQIRELLLQLHQRILLFVLRLFTSVKLDVDEVAYDNKTIASFLYIHGIFTGERLAKICAIYGRDHKDVLAIILSRLFKAQPKLLTLLNSFFDKTQEDMTQLGSKIEMICEQENLKMEHVSQYSDAVSKYLDGAIDLFFSLLSLVKVVKIEEIASYKKYFIVVAKFVNNIATVLSDQILLDLSSTHQSYLKRFLVKRSMLLQNAMHFFVELYKSEAVLDQVRYEIIYEVLNFKECLVRLHFHDQINLQKELKRLEAKGICTEEHTKTCLKALNKSIKEQADEIKSRLYQQGLLQYIGKPLNPEISSAIDNLQDLFPTCSGELLHLCLRHFGYDIEAVTNALLEPSTLPLHMQILLAAKEDFSNIDMNGAGFPILVDDFEEDIETETVEAEEKEKPQQEKQLETTTKKSTFSLDLEPSIPKNEPKSASAQIEEIKSRATVTKKLEKFMENASGIIDTSEAKTVYESVQKAHLGIEMEQVKVGDKLMVKHDKERKLQMTLTEEEKAAIRAATLDKHYLIEYEDEMEEKAIEEEQKRGFQVTTSGRIDQRLAAEIGVSGRFNRPKYLRGDDYEDEYDDTYDDTQLYAMDIGAIKIEDEEASEIFEGKTKKGQTKEETKDVKLYKTEKDMRQPPPGFKKSWTAGGAPKPAHNQSSEPFKQPQKIIERPQHFKDAAATADQKNYSASSQRTFSSHSSTQPYQSDDQPRGFNQHHRGGPTHRGGGGNQPESSSHSNYTGGRDRQMKERHKNQNRQRGADKKSRGGMF